MTDRWRTTTTFLYIAVFCSCICDDRVCLAGGFKGLVKVYLDIHWLSSTCPVEVTLNHSRELNSSLTSDNSTQSNSTRHQTSPGNCTSNLTVSNSLRTPTAMLQAEPTHMSASTNTPEDTADSHQPIVTFDEWTKEKLKQEHRKPVVANSDTGAHSARSQQMSPAAATTRNYASRECGAKVILSNPEAENTKAILNEKEKDEYMRNPCEKASNKFVVIELCETIQPRSIEFANYELFSSGPQNVKLWSTERFPNGEWRLLAEFTAADSRQIQRFPLPSNGVYVKFIKVELLSHYGSEHYCTLSVLKMLGISMVDEYEAEAEAASATHVVDSDLEGVVKDKTNNITTKSVGDSKSSKEQELSGQLFSKFVDVVKDKFGKGEDNSSGLAKDCSIDNPMSACYSCPKDGSYVYPRQFCEAFVWRSKLSTTLKRNSSRSSSAFKARRDMSSQNRIRRSRIAFLQRKTPSYLHSELQDISWETYISGEAFKHTETSNIKVAPASEVSQLQQQQQSKNQPPHNSRPLQTIPSGVLPASSTSHKESVFMKLNKRIAALELNMSLSSEYLSELSRQYVAQTDEHQRHIKQAKKAAEEAVEAIYIRVNKTLAHKIAALRQDVDMLSSWLTDLRLTTFKVTLRDMRRDNEEVPHEKCILQQTQLHRYSPPDDGFWTTEQVIYTVITTQVATVLIVAGLNFCYQRFMTEQQLTDELRSQIEKLVVEKVSNAIERYRSAMQYYDGGSVGWDKRILHREDSCSFRSDKCKNSGSECSSSSPSTQSDDSAAEEVRIDRWRRLRRHQGFSSMSTAAVTPVAFNEGTMRLRSISTAADVGVCIKSLEYCA